MAGVFGAGVYRKSTDDLVLGQSSGNRRSVNSTDILTVHPLSLLVFVDDTGHEALAGDHSYYGLGGFAVIKDHYDKTIHPAWLEVRRAIKGSPTAPLHGSTLGQTATADDFAVIKAFFRSHQVPRFAATVSRTTTLPTDIDAMIAVAETIRGHVINLVRAIPCASVALIVESSQRADPLLRERFNRLDLERGGKEISVDYCLMPKAPNEPGLKVADFIVSSAGSFARRQAAGREGFPPDFQDVFMGKVPRRLTLFRVIDRIVGKHPDHMVYGHQLW
jgi:hypothetical protein